MLMSGKNAGAFTPDAGVFFMLWFCIFIFILFFRAADS
jgi:hypothetical protein